MSGGRIPRMVLGMPCERTDSLTRHLCRSFAYSPSHWIDPEIDTKKCIPTLFHQSKDLNPEQMKAIPSTQCVKENCSWLFFDFDADGQILVTQSPLRTLPPLRRCGLPRRSDNGVGVVTATLLENVLLPPIPLPVLSFKVHQRNNHEDGSAYGKHVAGRNEKIQPTQIGLAKVLVETHRHTAYITATVG